MSSRPFRRKDGKSPMMEMGVSCPMEELIQLGKSPATQHGV